MTQKKVFLGLYDRIQRGLVIQSEKPHEFGLRDRVISGDVCNRLLIDFLRTEFPHLSVSNGVISKSRQQPRVYEHSSDQLSPQIDVICYIGPPLYSIYEYEVAPLDTVTCVLEVKKWTAPKDVEAHNKSVERIRSFSGKPIGLVSFRHYGTLSTVKDTSTADKIFLFSKTTGDVYPDYVVGLEYLHLGELRNLTNWISSLLGGK